MLSEEKQNIIFKWLLSDDTGSSSMKLCAHMLGLERQGFAPSDASDRGRCIRLLRLMPEWIERLDEMNQYLYWPEEIILMKIELGIY